MKINIAITGASGAIYARLLVTRLLNEEIVNHIRIILTDNGKDVMLYEQGDRWLEQVATNDKVEIASNSDYYCSAASGSGNDDALVVVPCSVGMMSRIACGISDDLVSRAADVMLKERRKLLLVVREAPFNLIHLQNMTTITQAGGVIIPASPSFYTNPKSIDDLCNTTIDIILRQLGIKTVQNWG